MLDLDTIFDPVRVKEALATRYGTSAPELSYRGIGIDDLPEDRKFEWLERAAIKQFHGNLPRAQADAEALRETVERMRTEPGPHERLAE